MTEALLAGGPEHGRRVANPDREYLQLVTMANWVPMPLRRAPRPKWWKHPVWWLLWSPAPPPGPPAKAVNCLYHRNGTLADGTPVYWYSGPDQAPPADPAETLRHVYQAMSQALCDDPTVRMTGDGHWEMGHEWYTALRAIPDPAAHPGDRLLGAPVQITWGSPRFVRRNTP